MTYGGGQVSSYNDLFLILWLWWKAESLTEERKHHIKMRRSLALAIISRNYLHSVLFMLNNMDELPNNGIVKKDFKIK